MSHNDLSRVSRDSGGRETKSCKEKEEEEEEGGWRLAARQLSVHSSERGETAERKKQELQWPWPADNNPVNYCAAALQHPEGNYKFI